MDYLQQKNREYERKLRDTSNKYDFLENRAHTYENRSRDLEFELNNADRMAKRLAADKSLVVKAADREMNEAKVITILPSSLS